MFLFCSKHLEIR